jgi:hypothetical protein
MPGLPLRGSSWRVLYCVSREPPTNTSPPGLQAACANIQEPSRHVTECNDCADIIFAVGLRESYRVVAAKASRPSLWWWFTFVRELGELPSSPSQFSIRKRVMSNNKNFSSFAKPPWEGTYFPRTALNNHEHADPTQVN